MTNKPAFPEWEKSTEKMIVETDASILMGIIIDTCFSRCDEKEMLIVKKINDLVSEYILNKTKKIYSERSLYQKELASVREREEKIEKLIIEAKIEQSWRCRELIEANADNECDAENYGDIVLLDLYDLQEEIKRLEK